MDAFKEWKKNNFKPQENLVDTEDYLEGYELGIEHGWEAALKWVSTFTNSKSISNELDPQ